MKEQPFDLSSKDWLRCCAWNEYLRSWDLSRTSK